MIFWFRSIVHRQFSTRLCHKPLQIRINPTYLILGVFARLAIYYIQTTGCFLHCSPLTRSLGRSLTPVIPRQPLCAINSFPPRVEDSPPLPPTTRKRLPPRGRVPPLSPRHPLPGIRLSFIPRSVL